MSQETKGAETDRSLRKKYFSHQTGFFLFLQLILLTTGHKQLSFLNGTSESPVLEWTSLLYWFFGEITKTGFCVTVASKP